MSLPNVTIQLPERIEPVPDTIQDQVRVLFDRLREGDVSGSDMLGWLDWPARNHDELLGRITQTANRIQDRREHYVSIGIGGSYMGGRALVDALAPKEPETTVHFAGQHLGSRQHSRLLQTLEPTRTTVGPISKSGTTMETASVFRLFRGWLAEETDNWRDHVVVTTDPDAGALRALADDEDLRSFPIPAGIGGRYSVFTAVGLLPAAVAGVDVNAVITGAEEARGKLFSDESVQADLAQYVALRNALHRRGLSLDVMGLFYPELEAFGYWWQQLFGESEGKDHRGLYPDILLYTRDLHSMGQYMQEGKRDMLETMLEFEERPDEPRLPDVTAADGLDTLAGEPLERLNRAALEGTRQAHVDGGVPVVTLRLSELNARNLGGLMYYQMVACALSGLTLGVNPFNQPGVEAYKENVKQNLGLID